ncbi:hypothetical protein [Thermaurantiacus sp.]
MDPLDFPSPALAGGQTHAYMEGVRAIATMKPQTYLDWAATAPLHPAAAEAIARTPSI